MKEQIIQAWDDLHLTEGQTKDPADVTIVFGYQGKYYEIDLTLEHASEFDTVMERYIRAATKIEGMPAKARKPNSRKPNEYYQGMRTFAQQQGRQSLMYREESDGKFFYPAKLRRAYEESLLEATQDHEPAQAG